VYAALFIATPPSLWVLAALLDRFLPTNPQTGAAEADAD
jgi:hypothetical protein